MKNGHDILEELLARAASQMARSSAITNEIEDRVRFVSECQANRATVRLLMACLLAKIHRPIVDPRKPYTEIGGEALSRGAVITRLI